MLTIQRQSSGSVVIDVEVADTESEREQGLMGRESLADGKGMLFVFGQEVMTSFWMKDTPLSLDIIFIKNKIVIDIFENAVPYSLDYITSIDSYDMAIEVPGGYISRQGIQRGDRIIY